MKRKVLLHALVGLNLLLLFPERCSSVSISFSYRSTCTATPEMRIVRLNVIKTLCACASGMRLSYISLREVLYLLRLQVINLTGSVFARTGGCCSIQMK